MPKELHDKLERQARKKGLTGKRKDAFVFGTLNKVEKATKPQRSPRRKQTSRSR